MKSDSGFPHITNSHPLIDLRLDRQDCMTIISDAGLPVPPKSSCSFCPLHNREDWQRLRKTQPDEFDRAVSLEQLKNSHRIAMGKDPVWFSSALRPLDEAFTETGQMDMFEDDELTCDVAGYCGV